MAHSADARNHRISFSGPGEVVLEQDELSPLNPAQMRVRTRSSLISTGTELAWLNGDTWKYPDGSEVPTYPHAPGYSNVGTVVEAGADMTSFEVGARVVTEAPHASHPTVSADGLALRVPAEVDDEAAAFTPLACTVLNGIRCGRPQLGDTVAVIGLGLLGQLACQFLKLGGARCVVAIDVDDSRLDLASGIGAVTHALNPDKVDVTATVRELTDARGADVVYEVTGLTQIFDLAFALARRRGRVVSLGSPRWPAQVDMMQLHLKALDLVGAITWAHPRDDTGENRWTKPANGELFLRLAAERLVNVTELITHRFPYERAADAYALLREKKEQALGVILEWPRQ